MVGCVSLQDALAGGGGDTAPARLRQPVEYLYDLVGATHEENLLARGEQRLEARPGVADDGDRTGCGLEQPHAR